MLSWLTGFGLFGSAIITVFSNRVLTVSSSPADGQLSIHLASKFGSRRKLLLNRSLEAHITQ